MPFLDRNTLGVKLGGVDIHKVMCDGYQVWPDTVVGDWRMLTRGHTHGNYGNWLNAGLKASTALKHAFDANKYNDPWWDMDIDRGTVPMPMFQIFNLAGGNRHVKWGGPWLPQWNAVTTPPHHRYSPTPSNHAYPIKEVRVGIPHGGREHGIRVEVDVDPLKMNGGHLTFEGCPLPFSRGRTPNEGGQSRTGDTYIYEAKTSVFFMRIEQSFFNPPPDISKILLPFTAEGVANQKDEWFLSLMHVTPPSSTLLFNWPNNFILVGGRFLNPQMGDDSVNHFQPYTDSAATRHFNENFSADPAVDLGPGNALKLRFHGTPPASWPTGGDIDLFDLAPWNGAPSPPPPAGPVYGKIDLNVPAFSTKLDEASNTFNIATPLQFTLPHDTDHLDIEVPSGLATEGGLVENILFSALADSNRFYGRNQNQDPTSSMTGEEYPPDGYAMQTRYGGDWVLPPGGQPGDVIYINVGSYGGFFTIAVITLT